MAQNRDIRLQGRHQDAFTKGSHLGIGRWLCCGLCRCFSSLSFDWKRRRYIWRAKFFYSLIAWLICFGVLLTTVLMTLVDSQTFFWNYRCGGKAVRLIGLNFAGMIGVTGVTGLAAILMARLTGMFSNYSVRDMMAIGKCSDRLGLLVKWVPWFSAASMVTWTIFNLVNLIWILTMPRDWCARRWSDTGIQAVTNCRMWYSGSALCRDKNMNTEERDVESCNDGEFLLKNHFFLFTPNKKDAPASTPEALRRCSFAAMAICRTYLKNFSPFATEDSSAVDWGTDALRYCLGKDAEGEPPEAFQQPEADTSDLYKYVCAYVVGWNLTVLIIVAFFYYVKFSSNFESLLYQPPHKENVLYSIIRPLTPWTT